MFVAIANTPRDYAWGSTTAIPELLGTPVTGAPQAELWLGTHPGSPAHTLSGLLSDITTLPFLLKVLAAAAPLSLQAHPTTAQAIDGFERENSAGVPLDAPNRNYKDDRHKPEIIFALTPFRALCGFRSVAETRASIERLLIASPGGAELNAWLDRLGDDSDIAEVFSWLLSRGAGVAELIDALVATAALVDGEHFALVQELATEYPRDPGIAISLMLNLVELRPGEALYLPAGNIHTYIGGLGIELMAASDNVLRGGLTSKHVDVRELLSVLDFEPVPVPYLAATEIAPGVDAFRPGVLDFQLVHIIADARLPLVGDAIVLCTSGGFTVIGATGSTPVDRGTSVFISADERDLTITGQGDLFVATTSPAL